MPGVMDAKAMNVRSVGSVSIARRDVTAFSDTLLVSSSPISVSIPAVVPGRMAAFTVAVKELVTSTPSTMTVLNSGTVNVTTYVPDCNPTIRYAPSGSVTTVRVLSMSAGLEASTLTPGSLSPEGPRTMPAIPPC
jgi:hypothetical protein